MDFMDEVKLSEVDEPLEVNVARVPYSPGIMYRSYKL